MKLGVVITMFDEHDLVLTSINNIRNNFKDVMIVVVQSDDGTDTKLIENESDIFVKLENLHKDYSRFLLPAKAITRNLSRGFTELYKTCKNFDVIVSLTGDTLITDPTNITRRFNDMVNNGWSVMVSQAIGQNFHADTDNPEIGISGGRYQGVSTTDFACCYFVLKGDEALENNLFSDIKITNKWTSEQCLGDELVRVFGNNYHTKVGILNRHSPRKAYSYNDGVVYHAKTGSPSR